ncbi:hypothetical protein ACJX0J_023949, partial [Zea mays]
ITILHWLVFTKLWRRPIQKKLTMRCWLSCLRTPAIVMDPLPLTIHHMPIPVTFAYFGEGNIVVLDPTYKEEAVMGGRMTAIVNSNGMFVPFR